MIAGHGDEIGHTRDRPESSCVAPCRIGRIPRQARPAPQLGEDLVRNAMVVQAGIGQIRAHFEPARSAKMLRWMTLPPRRCSFGSTARSPTTSPRRRAPKQRRQRLDDLGEGHVVLTASSGVRGIEPSPELVGVVAVDFGEHHRRVDVDERRVVDLLDLCPHPCKRLPAIGDVAPGQLHPPDQRRGIA